MKGLLIILIFVFVGSCAGTRNTEKITVASERVSCVGVAPMKCLLIKRQGLESWEFMHSNIEGFEHQPGYEYVLEIKKKQISNPAADRSSIRYILVKVISKTQKISEGMPVR